MDTAGWRNILQHGKDSLHRAYIENPRASALLLGHSMLVDRLLRSIWQQISLPSSIALVAVGGYGRKQLYPGSDIDLLILLPGSLDVAVEQKLEQLIGLLWDIGLEVGHSVRTLPECLEETKDITVQTNLLEARLLTGNRILFKNLVTALQQSLNARDFFEGKLLEQQRRHARFHDTANNLEPNLKESPGGLRDLQNILWISHAIGLGNSWNKLARESIITTQEASQIRRHEKLLENLRIRLHYLAKRREDRLLFDHQAMLAEQCGLTDKYPRKASEQLMQRYYRTAKAVSLFNEILLKNLRARAFPIASAQTETINARFRASNGLLEITDDNVFKREPGAILESFMLLQQHPELSGMSATTLRALWRSAPEIDVNFRRQTTNQAIFMSILRGPGLTHELRRMNQLGILDRYIPAFGRIVGQMQHDLFHVYTVDAHIMMVVRNLRRLTVPEFAHEFPLASELINNFARPEVLYLAGLFHDIAKGRGGDHSRLGTVDARRFCRRHALDKEDTELVVWLVENHLVMSATAQKQDLSDPDVIETFARHVRDQRHLVALYLLTMADIRGTSPKVWNAWKGKLLENLFRATQRHIAGGTALLETHLQARQTEAMSILRLYAFGGDAHQALWAQLETSYFLRHEAQEIAWHSRNLYGKVNSAQPVVKARLSPAGEGIQVMIYTPDRDDLFARICSFFERTDFNIVEAKIHTSRHGYALDSFVVLDEADRAVHYRDLLSFIEYELTQRLDPTVPLEPPMQGRLSRHLKHFPITPEILVKSDEKNVYHVLSVVAGDRPGLLSRIAQTLLRHHIHLHTAKIATLGERAEDTFLITGDELENPNALLRLETDLLQQLKT
ncbi:MAG: [protein-PII] uridylyltransferase [Betaproteobacteria bacterium]|nr:[protein-PII] uridylyltransferase [Betaproteobacteria bacterium]